MQKINVSMASMAAIGHSSVYVALLQTYKKRKVTYTSLQSKGYNQKGGKGGPRKTNVD